MIALILFIIGSVFAIILGYLAIGVLITKFVKSRGIFEVSYRNSNEGEYDNIVNEIRKNAFE